MKNFIIVVMLCLAPMAAHAKEPAIDVCHTVNESVRESISAAAQAIVDGDEEEAKAQIAAVIGKTEIAMLLGCDCQE